MTRKEPVIKQEPDTDMSDKPTHTNIPREIHLDFLLFANQQILLDRPCNLEYGEIGFDELTPKEHIPPMEINLDGMTAEHFKTMVSNHLNIHCRYLPVWLIVEEAEEIRAIEWTYRVRDSVDRDSSFTNERKFSGYGHEGFPEFLAAAQGSSRMARLQVNLRMARPLPEPEPMVNTSDMEEDELATSPPDQASLKRTGNRLPPPDENDLSMPEFLTFCKIPRRNHKIWKLLDCHEFHHWSAFQGVTKLELRRLGFAFGAVQLLHAGLIRYEKFLASSN